MFDCFVHLGSAVNTCFPNATFVSSMRFFDTTKTTFRLITCWIVVLLVISCGADQATAGLIIEWDFSDNRGSPGSEPSIFSADHVSSIDFYRGAGLNANRGWRRFDTTGWGSDSPDDFIGFGVDIAPGYQLQLDNLQIRTGTLLLGPSTIGLYHSGDGFASPIYEIQQGTFRWIDSDFDLSGLGQLTGRVEFRLMEIGNQSVAAGIPTQDFGLFAVANYRGTTPVQFRGTVSSSVPEPTSGLLLLGICIPMALHRNRCLFHN